jgi:hypothetical protein
MTEAHFPTGCRRASKTPTMTVRYSLQYLDGGTAMPVTVKSISLWRKEAGNQTGLLAQTLEPLAKADSATTKG